jgi:hypothetical protein
MLTPLGTASAQMPRKSPLDVQTPRQVPLVQALPTQAVRASLPEYARQKVGRSKRPPVGSFGSLLTSIKNGSAAQSWPAAQVASLRQGWWQVPSKQVSELH